MPRVQFKEDVALPFGGEAQFFKAGAWYTIGSAHVALLKRNKTPYIEEGTEPEPVEEVEVEVIQQPESEYNEDLLAAIDMLVSESEKYDFTADGTPKASALKRLLGYSVNNEERDRHWQYFLNN